MQTGEPLCLLFKRVINHRLMMKNHVRKLVNVDVMSNMQTPKHLIKQRRLVQIRSQRKRLMHQVILHQDELLEEFYQAIEHTRAIHVAK